MCSAITEAVNSWLSFSETHFESQGNLCGISDGQSNIWECFSLSILVFPASYFTNGRVAVQRDPISLQCRRGRGIQWCIRSKVYANCIFDPCIFSVTF